MDINALREFVAVIRAGSFAAAAADLGTPKSTVSKRVQDLETALGVRLIERTTRALRLTAEGAALLPRAERILADAQEAERVISSGGSEPEGNLRVRMPSLFGQAFAGRVIAECRRTYPKITLEIMLLDREVDLLGEGFDGGVFIGPLGDSGRAARMLAEAETQPVATPRLLEDHGTPMVAEDLAQFPAVALGRDRDTTWPLYMDGRKIDARVHAQVLVNSLTVLKDAAVSGAGAAYLPEFLVQRHLETGELVRLLPDHEGIRVPISFVYPSPHSITARLRAFIDVLAAQFPDRALPKM